MRIGELGKAAGVAVETIRCYETAGLLPVRITRSHEAPGADAGAARGSTCPSQPPPSAR